MLSSSSNTYAINNENLLLKIVNYYTTYKKIILIWAERISSLIKQAVDVILIFTILIIDLQLIEYVLTQEYNSKNIKYFNYSRVWKYLYTHFNSGCLSPMWIWQLILSS